MYDTVAGTAVPSEVFLSVKLVAEIVVASIAREKIALTVVARTTPVAPSVGEVDATRGAEALSSVRFAEGVAGTMPMSSRTFVVACWIRRSGSPRPSVLTARPLAQWFVPVEKTSAPLAAVYFVVVVGVVAVL